MLSSVAAKGRPLSKKPGLIKSQGESTVAMASPYSAPAKRVLNKVKTNSTALIQTRDSPLRATPSKMRTTTSCGSSVVPGRSIGVKPRSFSVASQRGNTTSLGRKSRPRSTSTPSFSTSCGASTDTTARSASISRCNSPSGAWLLGAWSARLRLPRAVPSEGCCKSANVSSVKIRSPKTFVQAELACLLARQPSADTTAVYYAILPSVSERFWVTIKQ